MSYYQKQGVIPPKRHTQLRDDSTGALRYEELISTRGFEGPYSLLYHVNYPVEVSDTKAGRSRRIVAGSSEEQKNRQLDTAAIHLDGDILTSRCLLGYNSDVLLSFATPNAPTEGFFRNIECDEMIFVSEGGGEFSCAFGRMRYGPGDLIVVPRGITYSYRPDGTDRLFIMEAKSPIVAPKKYKVDSGQFAEHSPFCERDFRLPELQEPILDRAEYRVTALSTSRVTEVVIPNHPYDVVGWDGTLYPYIMNVRDFEPLTRRISSMPDEQQAFETKGAAVCCIVPRIAEYHPRAIPSPPAHANVDCDEVVFDFDSAILGNETTGGGMLSIHPRGLLHAAPRYEDAIGTTFLSRSAVMVDTFNPLILTEAFEAMETPEYFKRWLRTQNKERVA